MLFAWVGRCNRRFYPHGAKRRAWFPSVAWWFCLVLGGVTCIYGLSHSTVPSFATRITAVGKASDCIEMKVGRSTQFAFKFYPEDGSSINIETHIIMPHWGNAEKFTGRTWRIVYLNDAARNPVNEAIDIEILNGDSAGWHDSLNARPFGIWLGIPIGAAMGSFGYLGIRYRKADLAEAEQSATESSNP